MEQAGLLRVPVLQHGNLQHNILRHCYPFSFTTVEEPNALWNTRNPELLFAAAPLFARTPKTQPFVHGVLVYLASQMPGFGAVPQGIGLGEQIQVPRGCSVRWGAVNRQFCFYLAGNIIWLRGKVK